MPRIAGKPEQGVQAVVLTLRIFETLADSGPLGVTALARALQTTKSRIFRHLQTLVRQGYLVQSPDSEQYRVGPQLVGLGWRVSDTFDLISLATPILRELRDTLGHSCVISQVEANGMRVLIAISGLSSIEIGVKRGSLLTFHASAQGKVALAFAPPELRAQIFRSRLDMLTPRTITSQTALRSEIERIANQGWGVAPNEAMTGINTLAAPIFDASKACIATVGIVDSIQFIEEMPTEEQIHHTAAAAARISAALGYRADDRLRRA